MSSFRVAIITTLLVYISCAKRVSQQNVKTSAEENVQSTSSTDQLIFAHIVSIKYLKEIKFCLIFRINMIIFHLNRFIATVIAISNTFTQMILGKMKVIGSVALAN